MTVAFELRPMVDGDLDQVAALDAATRPQAWTRDAFAAELAQPDRHWLVACQEPAPHAVIAFAGMMTAADEATVMNIVVDRPWQRKGIGSRLLEALQAKAEQQSAPAVTLEVRTTNESAIAFYQRHGFVSEGQRPRYYPDGTDALIMWNREPGT